MAFQVLYEGEWITKIDKIKEMMEHLVNREHLKATTPLEYQGYSLGNAKKSGVLF